MKMTICHYLEVSLDTSQTYLQSIYNFCHPGCPDCKFTLLLSAEHLEENVLFVMFSTDSTVAEKKKEEEDCSVVTKREARAVVLFCSCFVID